MGQHLECSKCHCKDVANFKFDETGKFFVCDCGAINKLYDTYTIVQHQGTVEVDGIATKNNTLERANQLLSSNEYDKANKKYKEVLELDPTNYEAWWGRFLCEIYFAKYYGYQDRYGNSSPYIKANIIYEHLTKYAYKAIDYAPAEYKESYKKAIAEYEKYVNDYNNGVYNKKGILQTIFDKLTNKT